MAVARRATARSDSVVLPHEGIHPAQADELADRMEEMQLNPATILLVDQMSALALSLADRAYVLEGGRIAASGPADEIAREYKAILKGAR